MAHNRQASTTPHSIVASVVESPTARFLTYTAIGLVAVAVVILLANGLKTAWPEGWHFLEQIGGIIQTIWGAINKALTPVLGIGLDVAVPAFVFIVLGFVSHLFDDKTGIRPVVGAFLFVIAAWLPQPFKFLAVGVGSAIMVEDRRMLMAAAIPTALVLAVTILLGVVVIFVPELSALRSGFLDFGSVQDVLTLVVYLFAWDLLIYYMIDPNKRGAMGFVAVGAHMVQWASTKANPIIGIAAPTVEGMLLTFQKIDKAFTPDFGTTFTNLVYLGAWGLFFLMIVWELIEIDELKAVTIQLWYFLYRGAIATFEDIKNIPIPADIPVVSYILQLIQWIPQAVWFGYTLMLLATYVEESPEVEAGGDLPFIQRLFLDSKLNIPHGIPLFGGKSVPITIILAILGFYIFAKVAWGA